uniref:Membrane transporter protein n=1 Tax=viral metagenome TaxID=1070528 RepID=A0A6C0IM15_9ZZZZ
MNKELLYGIYLLIGILSGVSMGIIGVGAGMLTIPLLLYTGLSVQEAVATSLIIQLLPQSLPGVMLYWNKKVINLKLIIISAFLLIGSLIGIYIGSYLVTKNIINTEEMHILLASILFVSSLYIFYKEIYGRDTDLAIIDN